MADMSLQTLTDRAAISDVVHAYASAIDRRDWAAFRSLFTDRVFIDMRSFDPTRYREVGADELLELAKPLGQFDATQHMSSNHVHRIDGDQANCTTYMQAGHFMKRADGDFSCFLYGYYTYDLTRSATGWKIRRYALNITGQQGDPRVFEWAGMR
jgi:hypothetical protein